MQQDSLFRGSIVARFAHFITIAPLHKLPLMLALISLEYASNNTLTNNAGRVFRFWKR